MPNRTRPTPEESAQKASYKTVKEAFVLTHPHTYLLNLNLGDWSDDGHGKTDVRTLGCNMPFEKVVEAYQAACKKLPTDVHPTEIFSGYEETDLSEDVYFKVFDAGYDLLAGFNEAEERVRRERELKETWKDLLRHPQVDREEFGLYVLWFCQQGNPDLQFSDEKVQDLFGYYGIREHCGYGLFCS